MNRETEREERASGEAPNRLAAADSPYLLQHAGNPVHWYPWGDEAFAAARREDKPVFLSIGYSACHWCHVMKRESFEDGKIARLLNETFVSVKVDREERPDVDNVYMMFCRIMTGSGGWPLTIIMTPDKKPFFAATYIPRESRGGSPGMLELIPRIGELWSSRRDRIDASARQIVEVMAAAGETESGERLGTDVLDAAYRQLESQYDGRHSGFGGAPKFPMPNHVLFLLRHGRRNSGSSAWKMVQETLHAMARGGIFDQVGFGFHRYATDAEWKAPHFEKMLYDQALLLTAYTEAFQATGDDNLALTARRIAAYVLRDLAAPEGGFYSSENAESEGVEGRFYTWPMDEVRRVLNEEDAALAQSIFGLREEGNMTAEAGGILPGANVLHRARSLSAPADAIERIRARLYDARASRIRPSLDDKILADWNGLAIAGLARAGCVLNEPKHTAAAQRAADFVAARMLDSGRRLFHCYRRGRVGIPAHADDYAFLVWGLLELYESTFDMRRLELAIDLQDAMIERFWDGKRGGFFFAADDGERLPARLKEIHDGAVPSANSVAMLNLLRLERMTGASAYGERAELLGRVFAPAVRANPAAHTMLLTAVDFAVGPSFEIVLAGDPAWPDAGRFLARLRAIFVPNKVVLLREDGDAPPIVRLAPFTADQTPLDGMTTAYVCRDFACERPTTDPDKMVALMEIA